MATPENRLAGLEGRILRRRERNVRLAQRLERRAHDRALQAAGVDVPRLELDPSTGGIRRGSSAADAIVARQQARDRIVRGQDPRFQTAEQQREAVRQLTPRTGDRSRNVTEADVLLAEARPVERFIARQQAFTPLGGLSKAVESVAGAAETLFVDPLSFVGAGTGARGPVVRGIQRRRALEAATEAQPEHGDLSHRLASVGTDITRVGAELALIRRIPRVGPTLAGEVPTTLRAGQAGSRLARTGRRALVEGAAAGATEGVVAVAEGASTEEAVTRQQFGFAAGTAIGGVVGGVAERIAARRAAATAAARARALGDARLAEQTLQSEADAFANAQRLAAQEEEAISRAFEGRIGPERQLPAGRPETPRGAFEMGGERAPLREQLRAAHAARRARESLPPPESGVRVEGLTDVAERAIRRGEIPGEAASTRARTRPPPASEPESVVRSLRRRIADALDPERAKELEEAYTDRLTGLRNQEAFRRALPRLEADRGTELVLIDLRNFKGINDLVSMKAGDEKLQMVADVIDRIAADEVGRRNLFRAGGDEFVIAVPRGQGQRIGRQVVREVGSTPIADTPLSFGARFGVGNTFDAADKAAKVAKAEETGQRFRDVGRATTADPPPTAAQPRSIDENVARSVQVRRQKSRRAASEPPVTGRPAMKPPHDATKGPEGPVDLEVDAKTGRVIPNTRTNAVRQKSAFTDSGEGGYLVNPKRDALEAEPEANLQPHEKRVQDQISVGEGRSWRERLPSVLDLYTMLVRRTAGIESANRLLGGTGRESIDDAAVAAHLASGSARRAEAFLEYGPGRWTPDGLWEQTGTPGLYEILAPLTGKLNQFRRYLLAARTLEVAKRDIKTGVSLEDAQRIVAETPEQIKQAQRQIVAYLRDVARYYADATGMPDERLQAMFALGENYMPLTRLFEGQDPLSLGAGTVGRPGQMFRQLVGSKRRVLDPIESVVDYTQRMIRAADTNRIAKNLVDAAEENPAQSMGLVARISNAPGSQVSQAAERLQNSAAARGITLTPQDAFDLAEALGAGNINLADDVVRVWRGGKLESYRVAPAIARGIRALQPRDMDMFLKIMGLVPRALKAGVTLNPGFQAFNFIRDVFSAKVQSEYGFRLTQDGFRGFYQSAKAQWLGQASDVYREFAGAGGGFSSIRGAERRGAQQALRRALPRVQSRTGRVFDVATMPLFHPVEFLKRFAVPFEEAARVGEYMRAKTNNANSVDAVLASKKVTVDFQQIGATMQGVSYATAFLNAGIQSLDTAFRVGVRPITRAAREQTAADAAVTLVKESAQVYGGAALAISLPSIYLWAANRGDVEIEDLRKSEAGLIYWFARTPEGEIIRMPKPFIWGQIFGTGVEAALDDAFEQDPEAMERWAGGVRDMAAVNMIPNAIQIPVEQFANRSIAFGTPIVPQELERLEPRMQATERTSRIARKLGELLGHTPLGEQSPARIDKIMRDIGGTLPADLLRQMDMAIDRFEGDAITEPAPINSDMIAIGRFFQRDPTLSVESVQKFWDNATAAEEAMNSFRELQARGDAVAQDALFQRRLEDFAVAALYEASRQQISELRNAMEAVRTMPDDMFQEGEDPATRKRELIDEYTREYVEIARITNEVAADILTELEPAGAP